MTEDFELCAFERRNVGPKNQFVFRRHSSHVQAAAKAIQRRQHPEWSQYREDVRAA